MRSWSTIWGAHREITVAFFRKITVLSNSWRCSEVGTVLPLRCSNQNAKSLTHNVKSVLAASCNRRWVSNVPYIRRKRTPTASALTTYISIALPKPSISGVDHQPFSTFLPFPPSALRHSSTGCDLVFAAFRDPTGEHAALVSAATCP